MALLDLAGAPGVDAWHRSSACRSDSCSSWPEPQCRRLGRRTAKPSARRLNVPLIVRRVEVKRRGRGIEAAARDVRYAALAEAAREAGARIVMTAHHRDDRLETFLLQWMRGAGPDGLAAFPAARVFGWRSAIVAPADRRSLAPTSSAMSSCAHSRYVDDDSNDDAALLRNARAARRAAAPRCAAPGISRSRGALGGPGCRSGRSDAHSSGAADLAACADGAPAGMLWLDRLARCRPRDRPACCARGWQPGARGTEPRAACSKCWIRRAHARSDARLLVRLGSHEVRRYRGLLLLKRRRRFEPATRACSVARRRRNTRCPAGAAY